MRIRQVETSDFGPRSDDLSYRILKLDFIPPDYAKSDCISRPISFSDENKTQKLGIRWSHNKRPKPRVFFSHPSRLSFRFFALRLFFFRSIYLLVCSCSVSLYISFYFVCSFLYFVTVVYFIFAKLFCVSLSFFFPCFGVSG